ncbi:MAG: hypothetical protein ACRCTA_02115, partial [Bacilli bacterium]
IVMNELLFKQINSGYKIFIEASISFRQAIIKEEYLSNQIDKIQIKQALQKLERYQSKEEMAYYYQLIDEEQYSLFTKVIMEDYYDQVYTWSKHKYDLKIIHNESNNCLNELKTFYHNQEKEQEYATHSH